MLLSARGQAAFFTAAARDPLTWCVKKAACPLLLLVLVLVPSAALAQRETTRDALERLEETLDVRLSATAVELFLRGARVWVHPRSGQAGRHTTVAAHMPKAHRAHQEWSPSRRVRWGATIGPETATLVEQILASRPHPEQGYRSCLGLLRLAKRFGPARLNAACARAVALSALRACRGCGAVHLSRGDGPTPA